nr:MAG TPA: hypothetical protein [Bacteriophage sp.]
MLYAEFIILFGKDFLHPYRINFVACPYSDLTLLNAVCGIYHFIW